MLPDAETLAAEVVLLVKTALTPVLERLAAAEARLALTLSYEQVLSEVRDRVLVIETKAATPPLLDAPIALTPVLERVAAAEARLQTLGDLRDRVVTIETKAAQPTPADPAIDALEAQVAAVITRMAAAEFRVELKAAETTPLLAAIADRTKALADLTTDVSAMRERLAVVETRAPVPGPAGVNGADGLHGKDGADGLSFGDLSLLQEDDRTVVLRATRGDGVKELGRLTFPAEIYRGVFVDGKTYDRGDRVTWAGSEWHANESTTTKPGDGSKAWTLTVKRGRDGRDGVDAPGALPVVKVGAR